MRSLLPVALTALTACASTPREDVTGMLRGIDEEEFKKMHELRTDSAPPRRGMEITIGSDRAYLSVPPGAKAPLAAVLVIHEFWGLNEHVMHWSDRLAAEGYAALAVDLYRGKVATNPTEASAAMRAVKADEALATLKAAHRFLVEDPRVRASKTAVIGWCFGGAWSLRTGLAIPELDAVVMYYGRPITDPAQLAPLRAPLLGIFGDKDRNPEPAEVNKFDAALTSAGKPHTIARYDANHAFANPSNARYDAKSSADAWEKVRAFLRQHLR